MFIIGDVHGNYDTLCALIEKLPQKYNEKICFVGDIIDRGKDSNKVVALIKEKGYDLVMGNHELMAITHKGECYLLETEKEKILNMFGGNGGVSTVNSYKNKELFLNDIEYFKTLPLYLKYKFEGEKDLIVSHTNISNYINEEIDLESLLWNRDVLVDQKRNLIKDLGFFNIFGHTKFDEPIIKNHYACIDSKKYLIAMEYPSKRIIKQEYIEK